MNLLSMLVGLYTYDKLAGSSSFKRAGLASLAGAATGAAVAFILLGITGTVAAGSYFAPQVVSGLSPDHYPGVLPAHGGIPKNVYNRMPSVPNVGAAFGQL
jgi:hypothetical protein